MNPEETYQFTSYKLQRGKEQWRAGLSLCELTIVNCKFLESRYLEAAHHPAHRLRHLFIGLPMRVVDGRDDEILEHLDILFRDHLRVDLQRENLLGAVDNDGHHAA